MLPNKKKNPWKFKKQIICLLPVIFHFTHLLLHIVCKEFCGGKWSTMVSGSFCIDIAQGNNLCNVGPWQTDNFYEKNNLYNVVSTMLGQHCIGLLSNQCCPNTSGRTLHKKITCAMLAQSPQTWLCRKITYIMLSWSACANIAHENYLCNVDPKLKNNFATLSGPTLHNEINYAMFAHG